jgi:pimeloyl-ACP methyl ester carboxylesterase
VTRPAPGQEEFRKLSLGRDKPLATAEQFAEVEGARIHYAVEGTGPALVLVHAGIADLRMWDDLVEALSARYRLVRYDLRGFGSSSMPEGFFSHIEDLRALLDFLEIPRAHLVGISFGGRIAIEFAIRYPLKVVSLTLVASGVGGFEWSKEMEEYGAKGDALAARGDLEGLVELDLTMWVDGPHRTPAQVDRTLRDRMRPMVRAANARYTEQARGTPQWLDPPAAERLHEIRCPALVTVGDKDTHDMLRVADLIEARAPQARKVVLANCAHMIPVERPAEFHALLEEFLSSASGLPVARRR